MSKQIFDLLKINAMKFQMHSTKKEKEKKKKLKSCQINKCR